MNRPSIAVFGSLLCLAVAACGPAARNGGSGDGGTGGDGAIDTQCATVGATAACYDGQAGTEGVGPCVGGTKTCEAGNTWSSCVGEVVPVAEVCGDGIDNNCNGQVDEDVDADGDGWTTCGGDCCDSTECSDPKAVNPGAYDVPGDGVDNDCDGHVDNEVLVCDQTVSGQSTTGMDYAKAMDICQTTTMSDTLRHWGIIDATFTYTSGTGTPDPTQHIILKGYGTGLPPHQGSALALFSTGSAGEEGQAGFDGQLDKEFHHSAAFPADWYAANGSKIPDAPGCPAPVAGTQANDPIMLTMHIRVPTNASSFSLDMNFFSSEFPEWTCTQFNDFFVILLDSTYNGTPANPADKNLAFYKNAAGDKYPVGVNLAANNTGLFTQCKNGATGCDGDVLGNITTCTSTAELQGTGLEVADDSCDSNSLMGGGTGWLTTTGNVTPGEIITLRIALWDTSDDQLDSMVVLDNFKWSAEPANPGTVIE